MKTAIIDNGSMHLHALRALVPNADVFPYSRFTPRYLDAYDVVILSGGHAISVRRHMKEFAREIEFVRRREKPLLGICLGFEIIAAAFGGALKEMPGRETGIVKIHGTASDPILHNAENISVYEGHRWALSEAPKELACIAYSRDGAEIIRHRAKPIYGLQFHPEISRRNDGQQVFENFLKIAKEAVAGY